jgi:hypothetical protein
MGNIVQWLENHEGTCMWKTYLGIECPGCGMQRSFISLLKGNVMESIHLFPALLPMIMMLMVLFLHLKFDFKYGAKFLIINFIFTASIILISYLIKIL